MEYNVKVWRQKNAKAKGHFETYHVTDVEEDASFLEMLDILNDQLIRDQVTTCQLFMRHFKPGATITVEPWRSGAFPVIKDLVVDRTAFDKIMQAGGFITVRAGSAQDGNTQLIPHDDAELSMDAAACVGCGACVATCKNGSAMLFVAARVSSLALLPQGRPEAARRARAMVAKMDELGFGNCTNTRACEMECPKHVTIDHIARLNREYLKARFSE